MFNIKVKKELKLVQAFHKLFLDENGRLKKEAKDVIAFLRDEACGRGELGRGSVPYFYDNRNRFDVNAGAFVLGKRRMFDLLVKYLSLDERDVFRLNGIDRKDDEEILVELDV